MVLDFREYRLNLRSVMRLSGYYHRLIPDDWIRRVGRDRFHVKRETNGSVTLHFDVYRDDGTHHAPKNPKLIRREKLRIERKIRKYRIRKPGTFRLRGEWSKSHPTKSPAPPKQSVPLSVENYDEI